MKKILLGISLIMTFTVISFAQPRLYFDFEGEVATNPSFTDYGTIYGGVQDNPHKADPNLSDSVGLTTTGSATYNGFKLVFDQALDLSAGDGTFSLMVYHPTKASTKIRIQVQGSTLNSSTEGKLDMPYTTPGEWQKITWNVPKALYDNRVTAVLFCINEGAALAGEQWYFDEFRGPDQYAPPPPVSYFNFEGEVATNPAFVDYGTSYGGVVLNPSKTAPNRTDSVGITTTGAATYNGFKYTFANELDLSAGDGTFSLMVYHPTKASTKVRIQVQGPTLNPSTEGKLDMPYTTPGEWQLITWNVSQALYDNKVTAVLFCINEGAALAGEQWYFDDFRGPDQYPEVPPKPEGLYFDFEGDVETNPVLVNVNAQFNGVKTNPLKDAVNPSDSVGMTTTGSNTWDGIKYTFAQPLDLSKGDGTFTLMVYHPTKSSTKIRIQVQGETLNPSTEGKLDMPYTTPGAWEKITWTVSKALYDKKVTAVLFNINEGVALAGEQWYFDEFTGPDQYPPPPTVEPRLYFNSEIKRQNFIGFQGASYEGVVDNPKTDTINSTTSTAKSLTGTDTWSGIYYDLPSTIDFSATEKFTMMVYSDSIGNVKLQFEKAGVTQKMKLSVPYDTPGVWKELTFDPATDNIGDPLMDDTWSRVVVIFDDKDKDAGEVWYFDNLRGPVLNSPGPVYTYADFETVTPSPVRSAGAIYGGVRDNPNPSGINVSDSVALFYTGSVTYHSIYWDLPGTIDFSDGSIFTMMIYSDSIGRARIQLEKAGNTSTQCKIFAEYTTPGVWAELSFDALTGGQLPLRDNYYNRMVVVFDNTDAEAGEEWYYDNIKGPDIYHNYSVNTLLTVTVSGAVPTGIKIYLDGSETALNLVDDGTNGDVAAADGIWSVLVEGMAVGDHTYDVFVDDVQISNGMDAPFTVPESNNQVTVNLDFEPHEVMFKVTNVNTGATDYKIDINNSGNMIQLYDDGTNGDETASDNVWTIALSELPFGDHVYDIYADGVLVSGGDDVAFNLPETGYPLTISFTDNGDAVQRNFAGNISIYPNPVSEELTVSSSHRITSIRVYDIIGSEMVNFNANGESKLSFSAAELKSGVYTLKIADEFGNTTVKKFIKK